jgi:ribosomal protein L16/L10AE
VPQSEELTFTQTRGDELTAIPTRAELEMSIDITAARVKQAEEDLLQAAEEYFVRHDRLEEARASHERALAVYRAERMWAR